MFLLWVSVSSIKIRAEDRVVPLFSPAPRVPRMPSLAPSAPAASLTVRAPAALPGKPAWRLGALRRGEVSPLGSHGPAVPPYTPHWGSLHIVRIRVSFTSASPASLGATCMQGPCLLYTVSSTQEHCQVPIRFWINIEKKETVLAWQRRWTDTTQGPPFRWVRNGERQASLAKEGGVWRALPWDWPPVVTTPQVLRLSLLPTSGLTSPGVVPTVESPLGESHPLPLVTAWAHVLTAPSAQACQK